MAPSHSLPPPLAPRLRPFGTTIFAEMSALAQASGAVNLSQGFPNFEGPREILDAARAAIDGGHNQYARSMGIPALTEAIAAKVQRFYGISADPLTEIGVVSGATEGIAAAILGMISPGDEVILFEPYYDSYRAAVAMAGGVCRYVTLRAPDFALDPVALAAAFTDKTRLVIINTPHNPTGKVFTRAELEAIGAHCRARGVYILADEVYEHLTYDGHRHIPIATLPGLWDHTLTLSSTGKTFSLTGWKVGYGVGPAPLVGAMQAAHQFLTFSTATPLQVGMVAALSMGDDYYRGLADAYAARRALLLGALEDAGLTAFAPAGTYFALVDVRSAGFDDDRAFARYLTQTIGVACIPTSAFYTQGVDEGRRLARFAFCKDHATLEEAARRLKALKTKARTTRGGRAS